MNDEQIIEQLRVNFKIQELVGKRTYYDHGSRAFKFFDIKLLETLLFIRKELCLRITINNWHIGGSFTQRGLRTNIQSICLNKTLANKLYLSGHPLGKSIDFDVEGMTAIEVREWLINKADELPHKIRLENLLNGKPITWCHLDVINEPQNPKVYLFNP